MEGPYLPEGSGGEQPPEDLEGAVQHLAEVYNARMWLFSRIIEEGHRVRKRRRFSDYSTKNCEEAYGAKGSRDAAGDRVG